VDQQSAPIQLDFMNLEAKVATAGDDKMHILVLPYTEQNLSMVFVLPSRRFSLTAVEENLTSKKLFDLIEKELIDLELQ